MNNDEYFNDFSDKAKTEMKKLDDIVKAINNVECDNCENNGIGGKTQLSYVKNIHMGENKSIDNLDK